MADLSFKIVFDATTGVASLKVVDAELVKMGKDAKDSGAKMNTAFEQAFYRLKTFKEGIGGIKDAFSGLVQGPMEAEQALHNVGSISTEVAANYGRISGEFKKISATVPVKSSKELADAMYQATSAGFGMEEALKLVKTAAIGSVAGLSTVPESMNAMLSVMNAFKFTASDSAMVMDKMFATVRGGLTTFPELSASLATVAPTAALAGVKFEDLMASVVSMTKLKIPTSEAITKIARVIPELTKNLGEGYLKTHSFQEGLEAIYKRAGGNINLIKQMVGSKEAADAVIVIGRNFKGAQADMDAMKSSVGLLDEAYKQNSDTMQMNMQLMSNNIKQIKGAMIGAIMPAFSAVFNVITGFVGKLLELPAPVKIAMSAFLLFGTSLAALRVTGLMPLIKGFADIGVGLVGKVIPALSQTTMAANMSAGAMKALSIVTGVGMVAAIGALLYFLPDILKFYNSLSSVANIKKSYDEAKKGLKEFVEQTDEFIKNVEPSMDEYVRLQNKVREGQKLSKEESEKLSQATKTLADKYPELVKSIDPVTGKIILYNDALNGNEIVIKKAQENLDKLREKYKTFVDDMAKYEQGGNVFEKLGGLFNKAFGRETGITDQMNEEARKRIALQGKQKAFEEQFLAELQMISTERKKLNDQEADDIIKRVQKLSGGLEIATSEWIKRRNQIIRTSFEANQRKVAAMSVEEIAKAGDFNDVISKLDSIATEYQNAVAKGDVGVMSSQKKLATALMKSATAELKKRKNEAGQTYYQYYVDIFRGSKEAKDKAISEAKTDKDELSIYKTLLELEKISADEYLAFLRQQNEDVLAEVRKYEAIGIRNLSATRMKEYLNSLQNEKKIQDEMKKTYKYTKEYADKLTEIEFNPKAIIKPIQELKDLQMPTDNFDEFINKVEDDLERARIFSNGFVSTFTMMFEGMGQAIAGATNLGSVMGNVLKNILNVGLQMLEAQLWISRGGSFAKAVETWGLSLITDAPWLLAAEGALMTARGLVSAMKFATGGMITSPTMALMGESGTELVAPKKDFLTVARELIAKERLQPSLAYAGTGRTSVEFGEIKIKGSDLFVSWKAESKIDKQRHF